MNKELFKQVRQARVYLVFTVLLGLIGAGITVAQMTFLSKVVDGVFLGGQSLGQVESLLLLLFVAVFLRAFLFWVREGVAQQGAIRVKSELRGRIFAHLMRLGPGYANRERTGELTASVTEGVERLDAYFSRYLPQMFLSVFIPLLIAGYVFTLDWLSAVLFLLTAPIIPLLMVLVGSYTEEHTKRQWTQLSRMSAHFLDALQGLTTLKVFGRGEAEQRRVEQVSDEYRKTTMKVLRWAFMSGLVLEFMTSVAIALVAATLGVRLLNGGIGFQPAFLVLLLAPEFYRPIRELGVHRHAGMEGSAAADRLFEILNTPLPVDITSGDSKLRHLETAQGISIKLDEVRYSYPGMEKAALKGVSLSLPAGSRTALVGRSGAGKSTLVNLVMRFIDPQEGEISANGVPIRTLPMDVWREQLALVPQRPHLFYGSVLENIRMARPDASREEVHLAAEAAGAAEFIQRLPGGYDTQIGENGVRLSGGEAQRLAIARAFLKDTPVLILDEPTSSLDPESEAVIKDALERLMRGRTVLVIAHRLNTIHSSDQIVVLDEGRVAETGKHTELLKRGSLYARLVNTYRDVPA